MEIKLSTGEVTEILQKWFADNFPQLKDKKLNIGLPYGKYEIETETEEKPDEEK